MNVREIQAHRTRGDEGSEVLGGEPGPDCG